jgi:hypothetical protein
MSDTLRSIPAKAKTRNSLSCAQCRYKHFRCDGQKPICSRCVTDTKTCVYPPSRRRGNPRPKQAPPSPVTVLDETSLDSSTGQQTSTNSSTFSITTSGDAEISSNPDSQYLSLYYSSFHAAHPCTLPLSALKNRLTDPRVQPLLKVICYVGSIFDSSSPSSEIWSQRARDAISKIRAKIVADPFDVQAILLYSVAVYWCNEPDHGVELLNEVIRMAVTLGMNEKEYAQNYGEGNAVLEESWRRTWWVIYITDAHIAGNFSTSHIRSCLAHHCRIYTYVSVPNQWYQNHHRSSLRRR